MQAEDHDEMEYRLNLDDERDESLPEDKRRRHGKFRSGRAEAAYEHGIRQAELWAHDHEDEQRRSEAAAFVRRD